MSLQFFFSFTTTLKTTTFHTISTGTLQFCKLIQSNDQHITVNYEQFDLAVEKSYKNLRFFRSSRCAIIFKFITSHPRKLAENKHLNSLSVAILIYRRAYIYISMPKGLRNKKSTSLFIQHSHLYICNRRKRARTVYMCPRTNISRKNEQTAILNSNIYIHGARIYSS